MKNRGALESIAKAAGHLVIQFEGEALRFQDSPSPSFEITADMGVADRAGSLEIVHADTLRLPFFAVAARACWIRASRAEAGSSVGSCGTSWPENARFRMD